MKLNNLDQKIGELVTEGEPLAPEVIQQMCAFKARMLTLLDQNITPKKMADLSDIAEKMINNASLDSKIKIALLTAFFKDLVQACLVRTTASAEKSKLKSNKTNRNDVDLYRNTVKFYRDKIIYNLDEYKSESGDTNFDLSKITSAGNMPENLKNKLRIEIFASEKDMDDEREVLAARTALKDLMPLASDASIGSFYAHVSKKFRDKKN